MEHFVFPGDTDFAADDQEVLYILFMKGLCVYLSSVKQCLWAIGESRAISFPMQMTQNRKHNKWLQFLRGRYHRNPSGARTLTWNSAWTTKEKTSTRNPGAERTSLSTAKATPWNSFYTVENPNLLVCRLNFLPIDQSFSSELRPSV